VSLQQNPGVELRQGFLFSLDADGGNATVFYFDFRVLPKVEAIPQPGCCHHNTHGRIIAGGRLKSTVTLVQRKVSLKVRLDSNTR